MALLDNAWYLNFGDGSTTGYYAVTKWSNHTAVAGEIIRQNTAPTALNERCFVCIVGGATGAVEPTWTVTRGAKNVSSSATYQEATGIPALNGDATNTPNWAALHAFSTAGILGQVIKDAAGTHIFIMSTAGTIGSSEPTWNTAAVGNTTVDNGATWTYVGLASSFTKWGAPHARVGAVGATTWAAAGNTIYVASAHTETIASPPLLTWAGTAAAPNLILCVNAAGSVPPVSADLTTGASYSVTNASNLTFGGYFLARGLTLQTPTGATTGNLTLGNSGTQRYKNCTMNLRGTGGGNLYPCFGAGTFCEFINTTVSGNSASSFFVFNADGYFRWRNTPSALSGTFGNPLIQPSNTIRWLSVFEGVDLSGYSGTLFSGATANQIYALLKDCKLNAGVTVLGSQSTPGQFVDMLRCSSGANNYRNYRARLEGTHDTETTITRTNGATDGTQAQSWKIITSANCSPTTPFECQPLRIWNDKNTGNVTVTVYGIWGGGAVPNNNDIWFDLEYYSASNDPDATLATCGVADELASTAPQSTDNSTWGGSTTAFKMAITFAPAQKGYIFLYVRAGKASTTFYVDPQPVLS